MIKKRTDNLFNPNLPKVYQRFTTSTKDYWMMQIPLEVGTYAINAVSTGSDYYYIYITDADLNILRQPTPWFITPKSTTNCTFAINENEYLWIFNASGGVSAKLDNLEAHKIMLNKGTTYKEYVPYFSKVKKVIKNGLVINKIYKTNKLIYEKAF